MKKYRILIAVLLPLVVLVYWFSQSSGSKKLTLTFQPFVGDEVLELGVPRYPNPGGPGYFKVRDFRFFISNIRLVGDSGYHAEPESYHLARFDNEQGTTVINLRDIPRGSYSRLEFGIGVDPGANGSITVAGDLDPNSRMAWSWDVGYKFVLFEGVLILDEARYPLVYHVGFDENYKTVSLPIDRKLLDDAQPQLNFAVNILQMFDGTTTVDMSKLPNVKFDRVDAKRLADNYAGMVLLNSKGSGL
jgi:hypothetical protein